MGMDNDGFSSRFTNDSARFDSIWVIVDRMTKSAHFIPVKTSYTAAKLEQIYIDIIVSLHRVTVSIISDRGSMFTSRFWKSLIEMAPYEALYGRKCRSPMCWEELGERKLTGTEIIQINSEKIPVIKQRLETAFSRQKSDYRVGAVAYKLALPPDMSQVHPVFNISMLRKYISDPSHIIQPQSVEVNEELSYEKEPVQITNTQVRKHRTKIF
ncbi:uncharacterized protein LOC126661691 [Mercurialis annua]|uniref:uncharacterized protein LOC126661691 n=1 Tax=Mercurialis annua TaxID=3986 RepID=UPI00215FB7B3|nr:uncharacterized protein LOC126661691 [Mercurialis annua]